MKIHFVASSLEGGGAERVLTLLANEFALRGNDVTIISFNDGQSYELNESINLVTLYHGFKLNHTIRCFLNLLSYYKKRANRPDITIGFMPRMNLISILVCKFYKIPIIGCEHNNHLRKTEKWIPYTWKYVYRYADYITVLTKFDVPFFESKKARVIVMPNPCTFETIDNVSIDEREKNIIAVGGLDRIYHKGFDNLLNLIPPILKENPNWKLKIAGGGEKGFKILNNIVQENKIEDQVEFLGFVRDVKKLMKTSEIFVLPSRYEGLPMVLLEAMSQGMACIAYDCKTGPSDIISNEIDGLLIEDQNIESMKAGLTRLIKNEELRNNLKENALKSLDKYSMDSIMTRWHGLFDKIIQ